MIKALIFASFLPVAANAAPSEQFAAFLAERCVAPTQDARAPVSAGLTQFTPAQSKQLGRSLKKSFEDWTLWTYAQAQHVLGIPQDDDACEVLAFGLSTHDAIQTWGLINRYEGLRGTVELTTAPLAGTKIDNFGSASGAIHVAEKDFVQVNMSFAGSSSASFTSVVVFRAVESQFACDLFPEECR